MTPRSRTTTTTTTRLYPPGTLLSDIPPHFRGMPFEQWRSMMLFEVHRPVVTAATDPPISASRDRYGMKSTIPYQRNAAARLFGGGR